jgi:hypothetical protein
MLIFLSKYGCGIEKVSKRRGFPCGPVCGLMPIFLRRVTSLKVSLLFPPVTGVNPGLWKSEAAIQPVPRVKGRALTAVVVLTLLRVGPALRQ